MTKNCPNNNITGKIFGKSFFKLGHKRRPLVWNMSNKLKLFFGKIE